MTMMSNYIFVGLARGLVTSLGGAAAPRDLKHNVRAANNEAWALTNKKHLLWRNTY